MFRKAIVHFLILFLILGFVGFMGCDDDGGAPPPTPPTPTPPTPTPPTPQTLAQVTNLIVPAGNYNLVGFTVASPVTIRGTVTWTSPPNTLRAHFITTPPLVVKTSVDATSPLITTYPVTAAEVGSNWYLMLVNSSATSATVNVTVQTVP